MTDLVTRMRCQAEDLHVLNPTSETVKCLSLGADELERLRDENAKLRADADRLDFITEGTWHVQWEIKHKVKRYRMIEDGDRWGQWHKSARAAIDAAMREGK